MRLYSTLTRRLEELTPPPGPIGIYVCGSTVYQRVHVGNARPFLLAMWLERWLERNDYEVTLVHNITDVDDKVYEAAAAQGIGSRELAEQATSWFLKDTDDLGLGRPDHEPRASETISEIVSLIQELIERDLAYSVNGDVYFRVARFPEYGRLSGHRLDQVEEQEPNPFKEDPRDFALWKAQKPAEDAAWPSPWGPGRPGWHIECSAMAEKYLGREFEIHGGGLDLRFPHHENELAQSRGAGRRFARLWLHNGMLEVAEEKMSKSVGNVYTLRQALDDWGRETLLVYFLTGHWRKPLDFSDLTMQDAARQWQTLTTFDTATPRRPSRPWQDFAAALEDDFNTPQALAILHEWRAAGQRELLARGLEVFGLGITVIREAGEVRMRVSVAGEEQVVSPPAPVLELATRRLEARRAGDFATADHIRGEILVRGWLVEDTGETFRLVPQKPRGVFMGAEPGEEVRRLAHKRFHARQWGDEETKKGAEAELRRLGYKVTDTVEGYVVARLERR